MSAGASNPRLIFFVQRITYDQLHQSVYLQPLRIIAYLRQAVPPEVVDRRFKFDLIVDYPSEGIGNPCSPGSAKKCEGDGLGREEGEHVE